MNKLASAPSLNCRYSVINQPTTGIVLSTKVAFSVTNTGNLAYSASFAST